MLDTVPELMAMVLAQRSELSFLVNDRQTGRAMLRTYSQASGTTGSS